MRLLPFLCLCILGAAAAVPAHADPSAETGEARQAAPPSGTFTVVTVRRAGDVAGGPIEKPAADLIGTTVSFGETLSWIDGTTCETWSAEPREARVVPLNDPNLSDTQVPPVDEPASAGDRRLNRGWVLSCDGKALSVLLQVDRRVLVVPTRSGITNVILEKPLSPDETLAFQKELKSMKFLTGEPSRRWDEKSLSAVSFYAEYRGAEYRFARPAITENLLDGLKVISGKRAPQADDEARVIPASTQSPSIKDQFPDYKPKETPDTLLDYRPSLSGQVAALPAAEPENLRALLNALKRWSGKLQDSPGHYEEGNVALGADPKQYVPSDEELMVAEICSRISQIVLNTPPSRLSKIIEKEGIKARRIVYEEFTFRHVDVMGSGRFFYASPPRRAMIEIKTPAKKNR